MYVCFQGAHSFPIATTHLLSRLLLFLGAVQKPLTVEERASIGESLRNFRVERVPWLFCVHWGGRKETGLHSGVVRVRFNHVPLLIPTESDCQGPVLLPWRCHQYPDASEEKIPMGLDGHWLLLVSA